MGAITRNIIITLGLFWTAAVTALPFGQTDSTIDPSVVAIDEMKFLGAPVAKDIVLIDTDGKEFTLGDRMGQPMILLFSYYTCDGICGTLNLQLAVQLRELEKTVPDRRYQALTISFDKNDTLASMRDFVNKVGSAEAIVDKWDFAVVKNPDDIKRLTDSVDVRYFWSYRDDVFVHPNAFIFVTPKGRVARYLHGAEFDASDLDLALVDADWERISKAGRVLDILAGACFSYNYEEGRYTFNYPLLVGGLSLLGGIGLIVFSFRVKKRKSRSLGHAQ